MELVQILAQYPAATLVFTAWPLLFGALLWWTMRESAKREERLIAANNGWQSALEQHTGALAQLTRSVDALADRLERLEREGR